MRNNWVGFVEESVDAVGAICGCNLFHNLFNDCSLLQQMLCR